MNEFGETPSIYVWPEGHHDGEPFGDDFLDSCRAGAHGRRHRVGNGLI